MDLTETPASPAEVAACVGTAAAEGRRLLVVGGGTALDRGNPGPVDWRLSTAALTQVVAYEPADMIVVVEAGMTLAALGELLRPHQQEWPVDGPPDATVGGIIAVGAVVARQLGVGPVRDAVLEVDCVSGDGRALHTGGRTVKNVSGYGLPRLLVGSLGTLAVIVQAALRLRPLAPARRSIVAPGGLAVARDWFQGVPLPSGILVYGDTVELRLEGWPEDVADQTALAQALAPGATARDDLPFPAATPWAHHPIVAEAAAAPSRLGSLLEVAGPDAGGLVGVGAVWAGLDGSPALGRLRARAEALGGVAPVVRGAGGLDGRAAGGAATATALPAVAVQRRIKAAFDPKGILAPGRFWGGL